MMMMIANILHVLLRMCSIFVYFVDIHAGAGELLQYLKGRCFCSANTVISTLTVIRLLVRFTQQEKVNSIKYDPGRAKANWSGKGNFTVKGMVDTARSHLLQVFPLKGHNGP